METLNWTNKIISNRLPQSHPICPADSRMGLGHLQRCLAYGQSLSKTVRTDKAGLQQQPACEQLSGADIFFPQTWPKFGPDLGEKTDRLCPPLVRAWPSVQQHEATPPPSFGQARAHLPPPGSQWPPPLSLWPLPQRPPRAAPPSPSSAAVRHHHRRPFPSRWAVVPVAATKSTAPKVFDGRFVRTDPRFFCLTSDVILF